MAQATPLTPAPFSPPPGKKSGRLRLTEDGGDLEREMQIQETLAKAQQQGRRQQSQRTQSPRRTQAAKQPAWMTNFKEDRPVPQIGQPNPQQIRPTLGTSSLSDAPAYQQPEDEEQNPYYPGRQEQQRQQREQQGAGDQFNESVQDEPGQSQPGPQTETDQASVLNRVRNRATKAAKDKWFYKKAVGEGFRTAAKGNTKLPGSKLFLWEQYLQLMAFSPFAYVYIHVHFLAYYFNIKFIISFEEPDGMQKAIFFLLLFIETFLFVSASLIIALNVAFLYKFITDPLFVLELPAGVASDLFYLFSF